MKLSDCEGRRLAFVTVLLVLCIGWAKSSTGQDGVKVMTGLDLGMSAPHLYASRGGEFVVCAQAFADDGTAPGAKSKPTTVRMIVVDLARNQQVAQRDFPAAPIRFAVSRDELFVFEFTKRQVTAFSVPGLKQLRQGTLKADPVDFMVVADGMLCAMDGTVTLDLARLAEFKELTPTGAKGTSHQSIHPLFGGWLVDGVYFDRELKQAQWIRSDAFQRPSKEATELQRSEYSRWAKTERGSQDSSYRSLGGISNPDFPISAQLTIPSQSPATGDVPLTLEVKQIDGEVLDSRIVDHISAERVVPEALKTSTWNLRHPEVLRVSDPLKMGRFDELGLTPFCSIQWAGHRLCAVIGGRLSIFEFNLAKLSELKAPFRVQPQGPSIYVEYERSARIKPQIINGIGPFKFELSGPPKLVATMKKMLTIAADGTVSFSPSQLYHVIHANDRALNLELGSQFSQRFVDSIERDFDRVQWLLGRPPRGLPVWLKISLRVTDAGAKQSQRANQANYGFTVLTEIPRPEAQTVIQRRETGSAPARPELQTPFQRREAAEQERESKLREVREQNQKLAEEAKQKQIEAEKAKEVAQQKREERKQAEVAEKNAKQLKTIQQVVCTVFLIAAAVIGMIWWGHAESTRALKLFQDWAASQESRKIPSGKFLFDAKSNAISPAGMYLVAGAAAVAFIAILCVAIPMIWFGQDKFAANVALFVIAAVFAGVMALAFQAATSKPTVYRAAFFQRGVLLKRAGSQLQFMPYVDLSDFSVQIWRPSNATTAVAGGRLILSLLAGNAAGIAFAIGRLRTRGSVAFKLDDSVPFAINKLDEEKLLLIAKYAAACRGEEVLTETN